MHLQAYDLERLQEVHDAMLVFKDSKMLTSAVTNTVNGILAHNEQEMVSNSCTTSSSSEVEVMSIAENYVSKILQFCKHFSAFRCLKLADQVVLLKAFYPEIAAICAAFLYNGNGSVSETEKSFGKKRNGEGKVSEAEVGSLQALTLHLVSKVFLLKLNIFILFYLFYQNETDNIFAKMTNNKHFSAISEQKQKDSLVKIKTVIPVFRNFVTQMHLELENDVSIRNLVRVNFQS